MIMTNLELNLPRNALHFVLDETTEISQATKRREKLLKQLKETRDYDAKIAHVALFRVEIDLDDGVKVNYEKVQKGPDGKSLGILAKI